MPYYDSLYGNEENDWANSPVRNYFAQSDPANNFLRYFQSFGGSIPSSISPNDFEYLNPDDPDISKLRELGARDSGARGVIEDYYSSMPTREGFNPSIGRKILGFLAGTLSGTGERGARSYLDRPYEQAVEEWKMQGPGITQRAKNLEQSKIDEMNAVKLGLNLRAAAAKARASQGNAANRLAGTAAGRMMYEQDQIENRKLRERQLADKESEIRSRGQLRNLEQQIKQKELENIIEFGRRSRPEEKTPTLSAARTAASQDIMAEYPELFDPETGTFKGEVDQLTRQKIQRYRDSLTQIYLRGDKPTSLGDEE